MTTTEVRRGSAYPPAVGELLPRARELADRLGQTPSRNRLMRELRVGAGKASALLAELATADGARPAATVMELSRRQRPVGLTEPTRAHPSAPADDARPPGEAPAAVVVSPVSGAAALTGLVGRPVRGWPVLLLALPAFVAIWSGWVGLGGLTGFGVVHPLPGIWDSFAINTAITLPVGMETYAAFALRAWLSRSVPVRARRFAKWSAVASLVLGALGQVAYHLMSAAGMTIAPWQITTVVACLPVAVLGMGAALIHLLHEPHIQPGLDTGEVSR